MPKRPISSGRSYASTKVRWQLIGEVRQPIPAKPGRLERYDYEYRRNGTVNLFVLLDVHRPWRKVKLTERRAAKDYAECIRDLVDIHYPDAETIRVVQDNLSTHSAGALYQTFPPTEARRLLRRIEFHYTPKHASWLNMVEIEIGVLRGQCLARRIDDPKRLRRESPLGNASEMLRVPASNGCLRQKRPGTRWGELTQTRPKSHNHCAEVLDAYHRIESRKGRSRTAALLRRRIV
jgi:hypothetical protein